MALREVDSRAILGADAVVTLYLVDNRAKHCYRVECVAAGEERARWETPNGREALDIYRHPFARTDAPDLFKRECEGDA